MTLGWLRSSLNLEVCQKREGMAFKEKLAVV
jgi:hypothetical protein